MMSHSIKTELSKVGNLLILDCVVYPLDPNYFGFLTFGLNWRHLFSIKILRHQAKISML
jgi:hypothetical protein